ncbi:MAG: YafY family transcriptional regulator [Clostridiales bacterium]|nr:YafY family transcriptional regulator [Clostridiales bacterium]
MKNDRLFGIVHYLSDNKTTTGELAARFGVSKRTILRDLNTLSLSGVPICTTSGNGGGVSLLDGYVLDKAVLSDSEREQIVCGLKMFEQFGSDKQATQKLAAVFSRTSTDWIDVDFSHWGGKALDKNKFVKLKRAVTSGRAVEFDYIGADGQAIGRKAYPLKLIYKSKAWYVQAFCLFRNAYRTFKINRMSDIKVSEQTFDPRDYSPPPVGGVWNDCENIEIKATFAHGAAYRVYDEFHSDEISVNPDGSLTVSTSMPFNDYVYGYLLSFGELLIDLEPRSIRDTMSEKCKIMLKNFSNVT